MPNSLILDTCRYSVEDTRWSEEMPVWMAQREIRALLGFKQISENGVDMRYAWIYEEKPSAKVRLQFVFGAQYIPDSRMYVCVEDMDRFDIRVNGEGCDSEVCNRGDGDSNACNRDGCDSEVCGDAEDGYFLYEELKKAPLANLREGVNILELACEYTHDMEFEDIYVIGDFGVSADRVIVREPRRLQLGDYTLQGYFHYAGSIIYSFEFGSDAESGVLDIGDFRATLFVVRLNGRDADYIINGSSLRLALARGRNTIEIEVVGSNRNLLGPFHRKYDGCSRISWKDFRAEGDEYTPDYVIKPYGLFSQIKILRCEAES
jgi:hypothetical protein